MRATKTIAGETGHTPARRPASAIVLAAILAVFMLLPAPFAAAEVVDPNADPMSPPELKFPSDAITAPQQAAPGVAAYGPAGCTAKANNPHESTSSGTAGRIKGTMQNSCPVAVLKNSVEAKLWQKRWWGFQTIAGPVFSNLAKKKVQKISAVGPACSNGQTYRLTGYGHYEWNGVHHTSSEKINTKTVSC